MHFFAVMNESLKVKARKSGFKVYFLAQKIGVEKNYLSMCLRGERNLSDDKVYKLKKFLDSIPT